MSTTRFRTILNSTTTTTPSFSSSTISPMAFTDALPVALVLSSIVILCIFGNILVILSVFTFRPLRTVQNFFIVSLAFSDMLVAIIVMPFHIVTHILKRWIFGQIFCQVFVTSDVLLCTSSILNLCAIALDRYWAISDPIQYARKRTIRRVLAMIIIVWILSATISIPPIIATVFGSDKLRNYNALQECELSNNKIYVIYSACGSFYIPALIMTAVYAQVFIETRKRFRERARAAAKLVNVARPHKNLPINLPDHHPKLSLASSIMLPTNSSLRYSASNCSGMENFSTDDAEETLESKVECMKNLSITNPTTNNHLIQCRRSDPSTSQISLSISVDDSKRHSINCENSVTNIDSVNPSSRQYSNRESKSDDGCPSQQNASVQTTKSSPIKNFSKDYNRRTLFKGKTLASLMHERQKISLTRERRLSRTLGIIISVFLLCWLPFFVLYILSAFINTSAHIKEPIPTLSLWLGYVNSAVNPLIYTIFNVEFRTAFKRLLFPKIMNKPANRYWIKNRNRR